jgi:hypothetical protein
MICHTIYNMLRGETSDPLTLQDFLLDFAPPQEKSPEEEEMADGSDLERLAIMLGADIVRK